MTVWRSGTHTDAAAQRKERQAEIIAEACRVARIGCWEWDLVHDRFATDDRIFGMSDRLGGPEGCGGLSELAPADQRAQFQTIIDNAIRDPEEALMFEYREEQSDGTVKYLQVYGSVQRSESGEPVRINGTLQDITERTLVEMKLHETIERYTSLKKYNHDAVISMSLDGRVINVNKRAEELTGLTVAEMIGDSFARFVGRDDDEFQEILSASLRDSEAEKQIDRIVRHDGSIAEILTTIAPIVINGRNSGYYIIAKDISEQKRLMIAKEAAEATNKAKTEFLAMMSHEIRTPMNGVIGMTDILMESTSLSPKQIELLEVIRRSGETLLSIINNILDFSKIDAGFTELAEEPVDIRSCIYESVELLSPRAQVKKLDISYSMSHDVPFLLWGDPNRLRQILINLIGNAVKFTEKGGVTVSVRTLARAGHAVKLLFKVKDTGIGIPHDKVGQLFRPFHQLDNFLSRSIEGTGLGLAISKKLVNLMGGDIWIERSDEPGATFLFTVTLEQRPVEAGPDAEAANAAGRKAMKPVRVLVAEDNKINQLVLAKMLENQGHSVVVVENGEKAVEAALAHPFDIIFMDVHMPNRNGLEAAVLIREKLPPDRCPAIVAVTANALKGDRERCLAAGMDEYLSKPLTNRAVGDMIAKLIFGKQVAQPK